MQGPSRCARPNKGQGGCVQSSPRVAGNKLFSVMVCWTECQSACIPGHHRHIDILHIFVFAPSSRPSATQLMVQKKKLTPRAYRYTRAQAHIQHLLPTINLHGSGSLQFRVHLEHGVQHVRLVAPPLLQTDPLGSFKVVHQLRLVIWVRALVDDHARSFTGRQTTDVGKALFFNVSTKP